MNATNYKHGIIEYWKMMASWNTQVVNVAYIVNIDDASMRGLGSTLGQWH